MLSIYVNIRQGSRNRKTINSTKTKFCSIEWRKNKTASWLHTAGFQNAYRIARDGYAGSIAYDDDGVNLFANSLTFQSAESAIPRKEWRFFLCQKTY
jgi:hypothetical protein